MTSLIACRHSSLPHASCALFTTAAYVASAYVDILLLMRAKNSTRKQNGRTFIETTRRAQIVDAAIDVLAEHGYPDASFAKIAKRAGLSSTGMISYYLAGKDDLIREVIAKSCA